MGGLLAELRDPVDRRKLLARIRHRLPWLYHVGSGHVFDPPYRRSELHVRRPGALGDVLLCTPAFRAAVRANPRLRLTLYTEVPALVAGLPYIADVRPVKEFPPDGIALTYEECIPPRRHIAKLFGDQLGIRVRDVRPDCIIDPEASAVWRERLQTMPRPRIVVNRHAGPWTPNKDWPTANWNEAVPLLAQLGSVIEVGRPNPGDLGCNATTYLDLRGQTNLADLVAILQAADLHVGPISGPVHIAAAVGTPSVVIYGGYESPICSSHPGNRNLTCRPPCSPCWLVDPCPYGKPCLTRISTQRVMEAVRRLWMRTF